MFLSPIFRIFILALLLVAGSGASVHAQPGYQPEPGYRDLRAYPPGYYPGKLVRPGPGQPQPPPQPGFSLRRLFGGPEEPQPPVRKPAAKPSRSAPAPAAAARQEKPKVNPTTHIVVFGDAMAEFASQGIDDMFSEVQDIAVIRKTKGQGGLAQGDAEEWPAFIRETLDGGQKITLAVVMLGISDRKPLKEGEETFELLSDRWKELYQDRVDAVLRTFQERAVPVVWIGLPPVKSSKLSEDLLALNAIYRESVERHGAAYVDVWPGFVDENNRYTATGPDVDGEPARLRNNDGVSFTRAGARKLAHFADTEIKRIFAARQKGMPVAATPRPEEGSPEEGQQPAPPVEASLPVDAAPVVLPQKPLVGPVLPLTRPDVAPGGTLISGAPKLSGDHAYPVQRALRNGIAPSARPGRADDFRWPPS